jgi:hypothetical protein
VKDAARDANKEHEAHTDKTTVVEEKHPVGSRH